MFQMKVFEDGLPISELHNLTLLPAPEILQRFDRYVTKFPGPTKVYQYLDAVVDKIPRGNHSEF
ncbi:MAG: hypothetical protein BroJett042_08120 [Bacteroidota bacterium]|nr:MAG: hypothetical protein BroJett042_08120 [Bacteroidota bacterium]